MGNKIHLACWRGDLESLQYYSKQSESYSSRFRQPDVFGVYPIHVLAYRQRSEDFFLHLHLQMSCLEDWDVTFGYGVTAMDLAKGFTKRILTVYGCSLKAIHFYRLGKREIDHPDSYLYVKLMEKYASFCKEGLTNALLPSLGPRNIHSTLYQDVPFFTPLFVAVLANDLPFLKALISKGADPCSQPPASDGNYGLLHLAARLDHHRLIPTLVEAGCDVNAVMSSSGSRTCTPLVIAAEYGNLRCIDILAKLPSFDLQSSKGVDALHIAAYEGQFHVILSLVKIGCKVDDSPNDNLVTPFHVAAAGNCVAALEVLLKLGASPLTVSRRDKSALHFAAEFGASDVIPTLIRAGLSPYQESTSSIINPYCTAVFHGELNVLKELVRSKCILPEYCSEFSLLHFALQARFHSRQIKLTPSPPLSKTEIPIHFQMGPVNARYTFTVPYIPYKSTGFLPIASNRISIRFLEEIVKLGCNIYAADMNTGFLPIHAAACLNDAKALQLLIDLGCPKNAFTRSEDGRRLTPMQVAAMEDSEEAIWVLAANGCNVDFHHPLEDPALHVAIYSGSVKAVKALLDLGASVSLENRNGVLPIQIAAVYDNKGEIIELLCKHGANVAVGYSECPTETMEGIYSRIHLEVDAVLAHYKGNSLLSCFRSSLSSPDDLAMRPLVDHLLEGWEILHPPLILAICRGNRAAVKKLIEVGADANTHFFSSDALRFACEFGNSDIVNDLIEFGAQKDAVDPLGDPAIHTAIKSNKPDVVRSLIDKGCDPLSPTGNFLEQNMTPFQLASTMCRPEILQILKRVVPDVDQKSSLNLSPLHLALITPHLRLTHRNGSVSMCPLKISPKDQQETVELLLKFGCHANATDDKGITPLDLALHYELERIVYLLKEAHGETGKKIKDQKEMQRRIEYLEKQVAGTVEGNRTLRQRVGDLEGNVESLEWKLDRMDARLENLESQKHQSLQNHYFSLFHGHNKDALFSKCLVCQSLFSFVYLCMYCIMCVHNNMCLCFCMCVICMCLQVFKYVSMYKQDVCVLPMYLHTCIMYVRVYCIVYMCMCVCVCFVCASTYYNQFVCF